MSRVPSFLAIFSLYAVFFSSFSSYVEGKDAAQEIPQTSQNISLEEAEAKNFIVKMGDDAISLLTSKTISEKERNNRFKTIFNTHFATQSIAKFCLGRYWRQATESEKQEYLNHFDDSVADNYASKFSQYSPDDKFIVSSTRTLSDGGIKINSRLDTPDAGPINIVWLVYKKDSGFKIFDVLLEGVSMSVTQRSEYASIIERAGGKISGLIKALETKQPLKKSPA